MHEAMITDAISALSDSELDRLHGRFIDHITEAADRGHDRVAVLANSLASIVDWQTLIRANPASGLHAAVPDSVTADLTRAASALTGDELRAMLSHAAERYDSDADGPHALVWHALAAILDAETRHRAATLDAMGAQMNPPGEIVPSEADALAEAREQMRRGEGEIWG